MPFSKRRRRLWHVDGSHRKPAIADITGPALLKLAAIGESFYAGRFRETLERLHAAGFAGGA